MIPAQRAGADTCAHCNAPIHLANRQLGPVWEHERGSEWCITTRAEPTHRSEAVAANCEIGDKAGAVRVA